MPSDVEICTAALLMTGADEINSFNDSTREAKICSVLYPETKEMMLQCHPWRFSVFQEKLTRLATDPLFKFQYAYQLPPDMLQLLNVRYSPRYQVYKDQLFTDLDEVWIEFQMSVQEQDWPAYFVRSVQLEMAAILSIALSEDESKNELFRKEADTQMKRARFLDSKQQPNSVINRKNRTLVNVRFQESDIIGQG